MDIFQGPHQSNMDLNKSNRMKKSNYFLKNRNNIKKAIIISVDIDAPYFEKLIKENKLNFFSKFFEKNSIGVFKKLSSNVRFFSKKQNNL